MGSVKDLKVEREATDERLGLGVFEFSDRYSVFDWGEMPDQIPNKGAALCMMAAWNFEQLNAQGVPTHYVGVLDETGTLRKLGDINEPSSGMVVALSRVVRPAFVGGTYDYRYFIGGREKNNNYVVPLEVIYRNGAPRGSSLLKTIKRLRDGGREEELRELLGKYGLTEPPIEGQLFPQTGYDFTTKFEPTDRIVSDEEAELISGLTEEQFRQLRAIREKAVWVVGGRAKEIGMKDFDGKHEYRLFNERVGLVDVLGTLDENRLVIPVSGRDVQVSKEFLRQKHKKDQAEWFAETERAKKEAREKGIENWKTLVTIRPQPLDPRLVTLVGEMYASACNRYIGRELFSGIRELETVMTDLMPYIGE